MALSSNWTRTPLSQGGNVRSFLASVTTAASAASVFMTAIIPAANHAGKTLVFLVSSIKTRILNAGRNSFHSGPISQTPWGQHPLPQPTRAVISNYFQMRPVTNKPRK